MVTSRDWKKGGLGSCLMGTVSMWDNKKVLEMDNELYRMNVFTIEVYLKIVMLLIF